MTTSGRAAGLMIVVVCSVLILSTVAFAHDNEQHVMGTVTKVDEGSITVKTKAGETKTVMVTPSTKYVKGEVAATQKDLRMGDRVVIHAAPMGDMLHATEVRIGSTPSPEHQH